MKKANNKYITLQIGIICLCFIIMAFNYSQITAKAQLNCSGPHLPNTTYPSGLSWRQNIEVGVKIFSTSDANDFNALDMGIRKWNDVKDSSKTCSHVEIKTADPGLSPVPSGYPPVPSGTPAENEIWVVRDYGSENPHGDIITHKDVNPNGPGGWVKGATIRISPDVTNNTHPNYLYYLGTHETGHSFGLQNHSELPHGTTIMSWVHSTDGSWNAGGPKPCDVEAVKKIYCPIPCVSVNNSGNCPNGYTGNGCGRCCSQALAADCQSQGDYFDYQTGECYDANSVCIEPQQECQFGGPFPQYWDMFSCSCQYNCGRDPQYYPGSPIVIDIAGNGYNLTNGNDGVNFDLNNDNTREKISWTAVNSDDAWLVLDRNENGTIDNGRELFGNYTPQPEPSPGEEKHGFRALATYDKPQQGGNSNGRIDAGDSVFTNLRLWQDTNHNGISEQNEMHTLTAFDVVSIDLDYKESRRVDAHGNRFKYRAKVRDARGAKVNRWAWDVFLVYPSRTSSSNSPAAAKFNLISPSLGFVEVLVNKKSPGCGG